MPLRPWYHVVYPREDLREGKPLDAAEFAVHLDQVQAGQASADYQDPKLFFERTYMTQNLTSLAGQVLRRLSGIKTETSAVFNMATQFGGGKTHSLTLLYHLAEHGAEANRWQGVADLLQQAGVRSVPQAKTAVFVGQKFDPRGGADGTPLRRTPWGEIAWQLAGDEGFQLFAPFDEAGNSPGGDTIGKLFRLVNQPILILMDELMNYISRYRRAGQAGQFYNFIQNLSEEARGHDNVVLAVSIPASELEMSADDQADHERTKKLLDRVGKAIMMAAEAETSEIIRRRLFEWDPQAIGQGGKVILDRDALATCSAYGDWVVAHRQQLPGWFPVDQAREMFAATYPFHPLLISVFERKWQSLPRFQRTRGVLRLLALWVSHAYQASSKGAYRDPIIGLGTAPLDDPMFRAAVFEQLGETRLEGPVTTDICGKKESHATRLDAEAVEALKKARLHRKVATTIFFESNGGQYRQGATVAELRLNVAEPELDIGHVETALEALNQSLYYLHAERNRYRFSVNPALNKLLADRLANIDAAKISERIRAEIGKVFPSGVVERILFAERGNQVPDRPRLTLVVLSPDYPLAEPGTLRLVEQITKEAGTSARTYKSALIWAIADSASSLRDDGRKLLAWEDIQDEVETGAHKLDETQARQLRENVSKARRDLTETVWRSYKNVAMLDRNNEIRVIDLGLVHSSAATSLMNLIINRLRQDGEIEDSISPNFLVRNWPPAFKEWSTRAVRDAFFASPQFPKLLSPEAINDTIANGVTNGILAYAGKVGDAYTPFHFEDDLPPYQVEISDDMFIITRELAQPYKARQVETPLLTSLILSPQQAHLQPGASQSFTVTGLDQHRREMAMGPVTWRASGGTIEANGLFVAGQNEGEVTVTATVAGLSGSATVLVSSGLVPPPPPTPPPGTRRITWSGLVPPQKWTNFYMKVLTKFAASQELNLRLKVEITVEAQGDGQLSDQKIEETKMALRELGLVDQVEVG
jgi:hypothetical protein